MRDWGGGEREGERERGSEREGERERESESEGERVCESECVRVRVSERGPSLSVIESKEGKQEASSSELVQPSLADVLPSLASPLASVYPGSLSVSNSTALVPRILSYNVNGLSYYASDPDGIMRKGLAVQAISDFGRKFAKIIW